MATPDSEDRSRNPGKQEPRKDTEQIPGAASVSESNAGLARLPVAIGVALACFLCQSLIFYALPLYFTAKQLPKVAWETWSFYEIIAWLVGPPLTALLAGRFGERRVWAFGLAGYALVAVWVMAIPAASPQANTLVAAAGLWWGLTSSLVWVGGISLIQVVPPAKRGLANALMMTSLGLGSIAGPIIGRAITHATVHTSAPVPADFYPILGLYGVLAALAGIAMLGWGQYPIPETGLNAGIQAHAARTPGLREQFALLRDRTFLILVIPLSLLGGAVFQAVNVYRPYRVRDPQIGLIIGAQDHGWAALEVAGYVMQLIGGLLIGFLAGKKASVGKAAAILAAFALCALGIGLAPNAVAIFVFSALFELVRQFMRWLQTGYVSEYMPESQRAAAIGISVTLSGVSSWAYNLLTRNLQSPDSPTFSSSLPFVIAAIIGLIGAAMLAVSARRLAGVAVVSSALTTQPGETASSPEAAPESQTISTG